MMLLQTIFGIVAGVVVFVAYVMYVRSIFIGTTKPSRVTWFIIAFQSWILLASYWYSGAESTIWVPLAEAFIVSIVAVLCIKKGVGGTEKTDIICLAGAISSLFLWWLFDSSLVGLLASLAVDTFAIWPTVKKSFNTPESEDRRAWMFTQIGNVFQLFAINQLVFSIIIFPIWRFLVDGLIVYALYRKKR